MSSQSYECDKIPIVRIFRSTLSIWSHRAAFLCACVSIYKSHQFRLIELSRRVCVCQQVCVCHASSGGDTSSSSKRIAQIHLVGAIAHETRAITYCEFVRENRSPTQLRIIFTHANMYYTDSHHMWAMQLCDVLCRMSDTVGFSFHITLRRSANAVARNPCQF